MKGTNWSSVPAGRQGNLAPSLPIIDERSLPNASSSISNNASTTESTFEPTYQPGEGQQNVLLLQLEKNAAEQSYAFSAPASTATQSTQAIAQARHRRSGSLGTIRLAQEDAEKTLREILRTSDERKSGEAPKPARRDSMEPQTPSPPRRNAMELETRPSLSSPPSPPSSRRNAMDILMTPQMRNQLKTTPIILQRRPNACGDACMQMVLAYHGKEYAPSGTNNRRFFIGLQPEDVKESLEDAGLMSIVMVPETPKQWKADELSTYIDRLGPIVCTGVGHFVTAVAVKDDMVTLHDPLLGRKEVTMEQFNNWIDWDEPQAMLGFRPIKVIPSETANEENPAQPAKNFTMPDWVDRLMTATLRTYKWMQE